MEVRSHCLFFIIFSTKLFLNIFCSLVGMAHTVFDSINEEVKQGPELVKAKCALLRGMAKFSQVIMRFH